MVSNSGGFGGFGLGWVRLGEYQCGYEWGSSCCGVVEFPRDIGESSLSMYRARFRGADRASDRGSARQDAHPFWRTQRPREIGPFSRAKSTQRGDEGGLLEHAELIRLRLLSPALADPEEFLGELAGDALGGREARRMASVRGSVISGGAGLSASSARPSSTPRWRARSPRVAA